MTEDEKYVEVGQSLGDYLRAAAELKCRTSKRRRLIGKLSAIVDASSQDRLETDGLTISTRDGGKLPMPSEIDIALAVKLENDARAKADEMYEKARGLVDADDLASFIKRGSAEEP